FCFISTRLASHLLRPSFPTRRSSDLDHVQQGPLALGFQFGLEFGHAVEMVLDGALVASRDEDQFRDARGQGLFDGVLDQRFVDEDRKSTRLNSSHVKISYAVFCLKIK